MKSIRNRFGALLVVAGAMAFNGLAMGQAGSVFMWGWNGYGITNVPNAANSAITQIATSGGFTMALKTDGSVLGWGYE